ncbi:hypothetical protein R3P38DRAFT_3211287 [Favolaschia claudopus]|uniref:Uncharacterized protein n=1 Tax=Favolaschia claudopus TaxID=2862362 RepID=A0AAW0AGV0_9AGAR
MNGAVYASNTPAAPSPSEVSGRRGLLYDEMDVLTTLLPKDNESSGRLKITRRRLPILSIPPAVVRKAGSGAFVCTPRRRRAPARPSHPKAQVFISSTFLTWTFEETSRRVYIDLHRQTFECRVSAQCTAYAVPSSVVDGGVDRGKAKLPSARLAAHTIGHSSLAYRQTAYRQRLWINMSLRDDDFFTYVDGREDGDRKAGFLREATWAVWLLEASSASTHRPLASRHPLDDEHSANVDRLGALPRSRADGYAGGRAPTEVITLFDSQYNAPPQSHQRPLPTDVMIRLFLPSRPPKLRRVHARHDPEDALPSTRLHPRDSDQFARPGSFCTRTRNPMRTSPVPRYQYRLPIPEQAYEYTRPRLAHSTPTVPINIHAAHIYIFTTVRSPPGEISLEKAAHCAVSFAVVPWPLHDHSFSSVALESESQEGEAGSRRFFLRYGDMHMERGGRGKGDEAGMHAYLGRWRL